MKDQVHHARKERLRQHTTATLRCILRNKLGNSVRLCNLAYGILLERRRAS